VTPNRHGSALIEFPNELEIVTTREFDAPIELVFDVLTKPEHVSKWFAPFTCEVTECSIDLRVGGNYHIVFVTEDGTECSFRGTYLEVEPPTRTVQTWLFEGWPDAHAVESVDLHEAHGVTKLTMKLAFRDQAGRDHMTKSDGQEDSFNKMEDYLRSLLDQRKLSLRRADHAGSAAPARWMKTTQDGTPGDIGAGPDTTLAFTAPAGAKARPSTPRRPSAFSQGRGRSA
jgi:uncharacterized protein YndB with AHSA1/START domain